MTYNLRAAIFEVIRDAGLAFAKKSDVPTTISQLTNDSHYQTNAVETISINGTTKSSNNKNIALDITDFDPEYQHVDASDVSDALTRISSLERVGAEANVVNGALIGSSVVNIVDKKLQLPAYPTIPTNISAFTNDSGYLNASEVTGMISSSIASAVHYEGSVATVANLPSNATNGAMYNVEADGMNYVWVAASSKWDPQAPVYDFSIYQTKEGMSAYQTVAGMSNYVATSELADITPAEVDAYFVELGLLTASQVASD